MAAAASRHLRSALPFLRTRLASPSVQSAAISQVVSRNFATQPANPAGQKIKPPVVLFGGTGNYASALFIAAAKANSLDKVESEILDLVAVSKNCRSFSQFIKDPTVPKATRMKAVTEIFSEAGFSDVTKSFLKVLADNGRLKYIESIGEKFIDLIMAHKGEVKVIVTTVVDLPEAEEKELKETMREILGKDKIIKLEKKIDPEIWGGLVVEFSQRVFDYSIRTRAKQMERALREPVNF